MLNEDMHPAVAYSIASPHEDLHAVASFPSRSDQFSQHVVPCTFLRNKVFAWNSEQQPRFSLINKFFQQILVGLQTVPSTNFEHGQTHHNLRINFGIHHEVLHEFFIRRGVLDHFFIRRDLRINFIIHHDFLISFPNLPREGVETCHVLNQFI